MKWSGRIRASQTNPYEKITWHLRTAVYCNNNSVEDLPNTGLSVKWLLGLRLCGILQNRVVNIGVLQSEIDPYQTFSCYCRELPPVNRVEENNAYFSQRRSKNLLRLASVFSVHKLNSSYSAQRFASFIGMCYNTFPCWKKKVWRIYKM